MQINLHRAQLGVGLCFAVLVFVGGLAPGCIRSDDNGPGDTDVATEDNGGDTPLDDIGSEPSTMDAAEDSIEDGVPDSATSGYAGQCDNVVVQYQELGIGDRRLGGGTVTEEDLSRYSEECRSSGTGCHGYDVDDEELDCEQTVVHCDYCFNDICLTLDSSTMDCDTDE